MVYQTLIPQPNDDLDVSVTDIQQNFLTANTVMAIDHYPFDNVTANKGFHKTVTSPDQVTAPAATVNAQFFGLEQTANLGTLQYSKRSITAYDANPIPSPITYIQSKASLITLTAGVPSLVFDFTGITAGIFTLKVLAYSPILPSDSISVDVFWNGSTLAIPSYFVITSVIIPSVSGNILYINYTQILPAGPTTDVMWTLIPYRLQ